MKVILALQCLLSHKKTQNFSSIAKILFIMNLLSVCYRNQCSQTLILVVKAKLVNFICCSYNVWYTESKLIIEKIDAYLKYITIQNEHDCKRKEGKHERIEINHIFHIYYLFKSTSSFFFMSVEA